MAKGNEFRQETLYLKHPLEEYAFSEGIVGFAPSKDCIYSHACRYDPNKLPLYKQLALAEGIGILRDKGWEEPDRRSLRFDADFEEQLAYFRENPYLKEGVDFEVYSAKDGLRPERTRIKINNPILRRYYDQPLPPIRKEVKNLLLAGTISNAILRTRNPKSGKRIIPIHRFEPISRQLREFALFYPKKLHYSPLDYLTSNSKSLKKCYSTWFYNPEEILEYELYLPSLGVEEELKSLPSFASDYVIEGQLITSRKQAEKVKRFLKEKHPKPYSRKQLNDQLSEAQTASEHNLIHPDHLDKIRAICNLKTNEERESPGEEERRKKAGGNIQQKKRRWNSMRAGMAP